MMEKYRQDNAGKILRKEEGRHEKNTDLEQGRAEGKSRERQLGSQLRQIGRCIDVTVKMAAFWVVAPCRLVRVYQRFRGLYCLHHQGVRTSIHKRN
jgi:hypothetical protein